MFEDIQVETNNQIRIHHTILIFETPRELYRNIQTTSQVFPLSSSNIRLNFDEYQQVQLTQKTLEKIKIRVVRKRIGKCSICCQKMKSCNKIGILQCHHKYHFKCLRKWLKRSRTCPLCRHNV